MSMEWKEIIVDKEETRDFVREFQKKCKFLIDESLGINVADVLIELGWKAIYVDKIGLKGHSDEDLYAYAWKHALLILTHDDDFLDDKRFPFNRNPGVIVMPGASGEEKSLIKALSQVVSIIGPFYKAFKGMKANISEDGIWQIKRFNKEMGKHVKNQYRFDSYGKTWEMVDKKNFN